jgi:hypothetical protein
MLHTPKKNEIYLFIKNKKFKNVEDESYRPLLQG